MVDDGVKHERGLAEIAQHSPPGIHTNLNMHEHEPHRPGYNVCFCLFCSVCQARRRIADAAMWCAAAIAHAATEVFADFSTRQECYTKSTNLKQDAPSFC